MADQVVDQSNAEMMRAWQVAMAVGRFMAQRRERAMRDAQQASVEQERAMRRAIEEERRLAEKVYGQALKPDWWDSASQEEGAYVYGVARRFSDIDPQAELAARRCEREAKQRWGIDVNSGAQLVEDMPSVEEALKVAPVLANEEEEQLRPSVQQALYRAYQDGEYVMVDQDNAERILEFVEQQHDSAPDWLNEIWKDDLSQWLGNDEQMDQRIRDIYPDIKAAERMQSQAQGEAVHLSEHTRVESREARDATRQVDGDEHGKTMFDNDGQDDVLKEAGEAKHAGRNEQAAWDTLEAREAHAQSLLEQGADPQAVRAAMTADKGLHKPASQATRKANASTTPTRRPQAQQATQVRTRRM